MARPPIYADLAKRIHTAIVASEDGTEIPSIRNLVRLYGAAPDTVHKALRVLAQQGEIASGGSRCRYVRRKPKIKLLFQKPYPAVALLLFRSLPFHVDPYLTQLLEGMASGLHDHGLPIVFLPHPKHLDISLLPGGIAVQPSGLRFSAVVFTSGAPDSILTAMVQTGAVVMTLDCLSGISGVDSVAIDCEAEARLAVEHLAGLGHRRIAFLAPRYPTGPAHWADGIDPDASRFGQAMLQAKQRLGLDPSAAFHRYYLQDILQSDTAVRAAVDRFCRLEPTPTALVCFDALAAHQAREALTHRNLRCPADLSIVTRDCISLARPALTALTSDPYQIGTAAAGHLRERLTNPASVPRRLQFAPTLIEGGSTGPAPSQTIPRTSVHGKAPWLSFAPRPVPKEGRRPADPVSR